MFQQQDVQELTRVLFDALEESFKGTEVENIIDDLYAGELVDYLRCIDVDYQSERVDKFLDFALTIIPFGSTEALHSLSECIETYLRPEILDGENKYYAESVGKKVDAIKGLKFGKLPQIMSVQLKRFVYDFSGNSMVQKKLNDRVTFPMLLDMNTYVTKKSFKSVVGSDSKFYSNGNEGSLEGSSSSVSDEVNQEQHQNQNQEEVEEEEEEGQEEGEFENFLKEQIAILRKEQKSRADDIGDSVDIHGDLSKKEWNGSVEKNENKNESCDLYDNKCEVVENLNLKASDTGSTCRSTTTSSSTSSSSGKDILNALYPSLSVPFIPIALSTPLSTSTATAIAAVNPEATATAIPIATAMAISTPYATYSMSSAVPSSSEVARGGVCALGHAEHYDGDVLNKELKEYSIKGEEDLLEEGVGARSPVVAVASAYLCPLFSKSDSDDEVEVDADIHSAVATCAVASQQNPSAFYYTATSGVEVTSKDSAEIGSNSEKIGNKTMKMVLECQNMPSPLKVKELLETRGEWMYELYAVLNHSGAISGGHYYAYIKDMESKKWFNFNDSNVTEISEEKVSESWGGKSAYEGINDMN